LSDKLSDNQVGDLIQKSRDVLDGATAQTVRGDTTLKAARFSLAALQAGLVLAEVQDSDENTAIIDPMKLNP
jgi:hypothetical protein